jgi:hypothetical protein
MSSFPNYSLLGNCNSANYNQYADWNGQTNGNVTSVGSNGGPSYYGTFDQNGNVWEIIDYQDGDRITVYGGSFLSNLNSLNRLTDSIDINSLGLSDFGFRICANSGVSDSNLVLVSDTGNINDSSRNNLGTVNYNFKISKYLITNNQYVVFLNSIARNQSVFSRSGSDPIWPYDTRMGSEPQGGIIQNGFSPTYLDINNNAALGRAYARRKFTRA